MFPTIRHPESQELLNFFNLVRLTASEAIGEGGPQTLILQKFVIKIQ